VLSIPICLMFISLYLYHILNTIFFLVGILWCLWHPTLSVLLTFLLRLYLVAAFCRVPILYHFHPFHYHTIIFPTLFDLNLLAHLLLVTAEHSYI
jgi:hypothetical protein